MTLIVIIAIVLILLWIVRILNGLQIIRIKDGALSLVLERNVDVDADGNSATWLHLGLFGSLHLPESTEVALAKIRIVDVTDEAHPLPVRSLLHDAFDDAGMFYTEVNFDVPNGTYLFRRLEFLRIFLDGLHAPYQGGRTFEVHVQFTVPGSDVIYSESRKTFHFVEDRFGYLEIERLIEDANALEQRLGKLFAEHDGNATTEEIDACIQEIHNASLSGLSDAAYISCLHAANEPGALTPMKRRLLDHIAEQLHIPATLAAELQDRVLRITTIDGSTDLEALGVPADLTIDEQRSYLAVEYRKWRARATHTDPKIAAEATARLEMISRARAELG